MSDLELARWLLIPYTVVVFVLGRRSGRKQMLDEAKKFKENWERYKAHR